MKAQELRGGMRAFFDYRLGVVHLVNHEVFYNGCRAMLIDVYFDPENLRDPDRVQYYLDPQDEIEEA